jgi:crotonobetainyl-CoA:carnitine CoA-transferase CaiB-like acyl-CoA transferase
MLAAHRVLDLTGQDGWMAGFLLAQIGANVMLVEPREGYEWKRVVRGEQQGQEVGGR